MIGSRTSRSIRRLGMYINRLFMRRRSRTRRRRRANEGFSAGLYTSYGCCGCFCSHTPFLWCSRRSGDPPRWWLRYFLRPSFSIWSKEVYLFLCSALGVRGGDYGYALCSVVFNSILFAAGLFDLLHLPQGKASIFFGF